MQSAASSDLVKMDQPVENVEENLTEICTQLQESIERREKIHNNLKQRRKKLEAEFKTVEAMMKDNSNCLDKWRKIIYDCQRLNKLSAKNKATIFLNTSHFSKARQELQEETKQSMSMLMKRIIAQEDTVIKTSKLWFSWNSLYIFSLNCRSLQQRDIVWNSQANRTRFCSVLRRLLMASSLRLTSLTF